MLNFHLIYLVKFLNIKRNTDCDDIKIEKYITNFTLKMYEFRLEYIITIYALSIKCLQYVFNMSLSIKNIYYLYQSYHIKICLFAGALAMPRWASVSSLNSSSSSRSGRDAIQSALEPSLLTTCVGSMSELMDLISKVAQAGHCPIPLTTRALHALFYYMRCSQVYEIFISRVKTMNYLIFIFYECASLI